MEKIIKLRIKFRFSGEWHEIQNWHSSSRESTLNCQLSTDCVSALCQPVSPFKRLHALYLSGLCQRVSLICKNLLYVFSADRHPLFIVNVGIYTHSHLFNNYRYFLFC